MFRDTPVYELTRIEKENRLAALTNTEELKTAEETKIPWPEVEFLFGEDENYQDIVAEIMRNVSSSITSLTSYAEVRFS